MLEKINSWYASIGNKIKGLAIGTFIVEALATIVFGIILAINNGFVGVIIIIFGPFSAFVSSWLMYGFGELIEKVTQIEYDTHKPKEETEKEEESKSINSNTNIWHCEKCGQRVPKILSTCSACGASRPSSVQPFTTSIPATSNGKMQKCVCGEKFYGNTCPNCGRTLK